MTIHIFFMREVSRTNWSLEWSVPENDTLIIVMMLYHIHLSKARASLYYWHIWVGTLIHVFAHFLPYIVFHWFGHLKVGSRGLWERCFNHYFALE